ncbi:hypothetical protein [Ralstonia sp. 1B3]|uniref:hypothetical protein n=1 Tax=Ralstonia sp. 1B3 TaxID=2997421 RepID=UPI002FC7689D
MRLDAFAERFSDAGYACLVFDYRNFGASEGAPGSCWTSANSWKTGPVQSPLHGCSPA